MFAHATTVSLAPSQGGVRFMLETNSSDLSLIAISSIHIFVLLSEIKQVVSNENLTFLYI
jgi:hypothetical protein